MKFEVQENYLTIYLPRIWIITAQRNQKEADRLIERGISGM